MTKELFLKLLEENEKADKLLNELYDLFSDRFIEPRNFYTTTNCLNLIFGYFFNSEGVDEINYFLYEKPDGNYTKENPYISDNKGNPLVWDVDSLWEDIQKNRIN